MTKRRRKPDHYYFKAKEDGYRSRAAYKLIQIDQKFNIFRHGQIVIDLCGAPGGWSQVAKSKIGIEGRVLIFDIQSVNNLPNVESYRCDITSDEVLPILNKELGIHPKVDVLLSDCAPKVIGAWATDQARQMYLAETSIKLAMKIKIPIAIVKIFEGRDLKEILTFAQKSYHKVKIYKPKASRKQSAERYLIMKEFVDGMRKGSENDRGRN